MKTVKTGTVRSKIKRGDQVVFIAGKEYNRYDSEGAMIVKRHRKPVPQLNREGGIIEQEAWVSISNVALIDPETGKPTRVKIEERDGKKVRVAKSGKIVADSGSYKRESIKKLEGDEAE